MILSNEQEKALYISIECRNVHINSTQKEPLSCNLVEVQSRLCRPSFFIKKLWIFISIISIFAMLSCSPPPQSDPYTYRQEGIQLDIRADQKLNAYDGDPHTIKLAVYQLTENASFLELKKTPDGLSQLLKVKKFDPTVLAYELVIIHPNESRIITLDRINGAKWVAVVAGYYKPEDGLLPSSMLSIPKVAKKKSLIRKGLEYIGLLQAYEVHYVPQIAIQLIFTPVTMYETSVFR